MPFFRSCICLLLLITTPISFLDASGYQSKSHSKSIVEEKGADDLHLWSYDEIVRLLDEIDSGKLEKRCSSAECEKIDRFLVLLAKEGERSANSSLDRDIVDLVPDNQLFTLNSLSLKIELGGIISSAIASYSREFASYLGSKFNLSTSSHKSNWKKTKKFAHKHRKAIIIGIVVVVAVVVVVTVVVLTGTAAAATTIATGCTAITSNDREEVGASPQPNLLREMIFENLEFVKDLEIKDVDPSFSDNAREFGSCLTHDILSSVAELASVIPKLQQEIIDLNEKIMPAAVIPADMNSPMENYQLLVAQGHERIDQIFATEQSENYSPEALEAKAERDAQFTYCTLPPPGTLLKPKPDAQATVKALKHFTPEMQASYDACTRAETFLKPYKGALPEAMARDLIHEAGFPTFPRPKGIPENYIVKFTDKGAGMKYIDPKNPGNCIRVMPGKPHSPLQCQKKPYVSEMKQGQALDKFGNKVFRDVPEAHIPIDEFVYRGN